MASDKSAYRKHALFLCSPVAVGAAKSTIRCLDDHAMSIGW
jgi:hypothetical protein